MISPELLKKLRKIEIITSRLASDQLAGSYHSVFKGQGMAFSEVRQYSPGDDVRFLDWNVSARMNQPYVKVFTEEREMTVMLLVDISSSCDYGHIAKRETIAEISALIAFSAISNNDRVGVILFSENVEKFIPPRKGRAHVMRVLTEILRTDPSKKETNIRSALDRLGSMRGRKTVAFLISDFQDTGYHKRLGRSAVKHDLIAIDIADKNEVDLPPIGLAEIEDIETGEQYLVDFSDPKTQQAYRKEFTEDRARRQRNFQRYGIDTIRVSTGSDIVHHIAQLFRKRKRRLGGYR